MSNALSRNAEYSHPFSAGYIAPRNSLAKMAQDIEDRKQIALAQAVASGQIPHDIAYGEEGLQSPSVHGISIDPTDYIGPGTMKVLGGALAAKGLPFAIGMMKAPEGEAMAKLIREAQLQIEAENAAKNLVRPDGHRIRNALIGIGAGGAGLAGGYYGTDYLSK